MNTAIIVQARLGSTRLPGKVLLQLAGTSVLGRVIRRLSRCTAAQYLVVATTDSPADDPVAAESRRQGATVFRGSECDVLSRYHGACQMTDAELVVRITSDCPLIDPNVVDRMIEHFQQLHSAGVPVDYLSNIHPRTFAHGLDTEIFTRDALHSAHSEARETFEREHVTPFLYLNPDRFRLENFAQPCNDSGLRWTLDEEADWQFFQRVFGSFPAGHFVETHEVKELLRRHPEWRLINARVRQKNLRAA